MFELELKSFIDSIRTNKETEISLQDGIDNLKILLSIHKSIKEKRLVKIEEIRL
jgi:predicted dehydrogenase